MRMIISQSFAFFFQAEDGIRDTSVTGVQTCALPISRRCNMATISCPHCSKVLDLPVDVAGKTVHCSSCEKPFTPSASAVASGEPPAKSTNPDAAVTANAPAAKSTDRDADDFGVPRERHDIAKKSSS